VPVEPNDPPAGPDDPLSRVLRPAGPVQLELDVHEEAGATVLAVAGELDVLTAPRLAARLDELLRHTTGDIVVDLRDTAFIDSSGLHILLNTARRMIRASRGFAVICKRGPDRSVIEQARLTETLGVVSGFSEYEKRRARRRE
jgi:anti-sigma B factor antagonist